MDSYTDYSVVFTLEHAYTHGVGWGVFDTGDATEIERVDENFPDHLVFDDLHAEWLVHFLAADGDRGAQIALNEISYSHIDDAYLKGR